MIFAALSRAGAEVAQCEENDHDRPPCGLCLWRLGKAEEALRVFERILSLNPNDNQGVRSCWFDIREGRNWDEAQGGCRT